MKIDFVLPEGTEIHEEIHLSDNFLFQRVFTVKRAADAMRRILLGQDTAPNPE